MRRFVVLVAMLVPLSLFVAGCGGSGSSPASKSEAEKAEKQKKIQDDMQGMKTKGGKMGIGGKGP